MANERYRLELTKPRDLAIVFGILAVVGHLLVRFSYGSLPVIPRLAGVSAAVLGIGEALVGFNIRARIRAAYRDRGGRADGSTGHPPAQSRWGELKPVHPLVAARAVMVAKASSLAGAGLTGLWVGLLVYVAPQAGDVRAAGADTVTAILGGVAALVMMLGALWLERCCVAPGDSSDHRDRSGEHPGTGPIH